MDTTYFRLLPRDLMLELFVHLPLSVIIEACMGNFFPSTICNNKDYWEKRSMAYYGKVLDLFEADEDSGREISPLLLRYFLNIYRNLNVYINILKQPKNKTEEQWRLEQEKEKARKANSKRDLESLRTSIIKLLRQRVQHDNKLKYYVLLNANPRRQFVSPLIEAHDLADALLKVDDYMLTDRFDLLTTEFYELTEDWLPNIGENANIGALLNYYITHMIEHFANNKNNDFYFLEVTKLN